MPILKGQSQKIRSFNIREKNKSNSVLEHIQDQNSVERALMLGVKLPVLPSSLVEVLAKQALRDFEGDSLLSRSKDNASNKE